MEDINEETIEVKFVTRLGEKWRITDTPFSIPISLTRYGLSEIINHLIRGVQSTTPSDESESSTETGAYQITPFDFIIDGEFLRTSIKKHLRDRGIMGTEGTTVIEYTFALAQPDDKPPFQDDDWLSALCVFRTKDAAGNLSDICLSAAYDGIVKLWREKMPAERFEGLSEGVGVIKSLCPIIRKDADELSSASAASAAVTDLFLSGSKDADVKAWRLKPTMKKITSGENSSKHENSSKNENPSKSESEDSLEPGFEVVCVGVFAGHTGSVDAVDVSPDASRMCSASWDKTIRLWDIADLSRGEIPDGPAKRRKVGSDGDDTLERRSLSKMKGHSEAISAVQWPTHFQIISGSLDTTIRLWDVQTGKNASTLKGTKSVTTLAYNVENGLCVSGHNDGLLRFWDPRSSEKNPIVKTLKAHKSWISKVEWNPLRPSVLLSASYDSSLKIWDLRSSAAMNTAHPHGGDGKVLCAGWWSKIDGSMEVISGGTDSCIARRSFNYSI